MADEVVSPPFLTNARDSSQFFTATSKALLQTTYVRDESGRKRSGMPCDSLPQSKRAHAVRKDAVDGEAVRLSADALRAPMLDVLRPAVPSISVPAHPSVTACTGYTHLQDQRVQATAAAVPLPADATTHPIGDILHRVSLMEDVYSQLRSVPEVASPPPLPMRSASPGEQGKGLLHIARARRSSTSSNVSPPVLPAATSESSHRRMSESHATRDVAGNWPEHDPRLDNKQLLASINETLRSVRESSFRIAALSPVSATSTDRYGTPDSLSRFEESAAPAMRDPSSPPRPRSTPPRPSPAAKSPRDIVNRLVYGDGLNDLRAEQFVTAQYQATPLLNASSVLLGEHEISELFQSQDMERSNGSTSQPSTRQEDAPATSSVSSSDLDQDDLETGSFHHTAPVEQVPRWWQPEPQPHVWRTSPAVAPAEIPAEDHTADIRLESTQRPSRSTIMEVVYGTASTQHHKAVLTPVRSSTVAPPPTWQVADDVPLSLAELEQQVKRRVRRCWL